MPRLLAALGIPMAIAAAWTVVAGKDLNWDLLHYHFYAAHALLQDRIAQDYFAASTQSYLNPVGYLPFYLMVSAGWHSVLVSIVMAALHALNVTLLFAIGHKLFMHRSEPQRSLLAGLAAALGAASAAFWATVGTSFLDPLLAVPMFGAIVLLLGADTGKVLPRAFWAGILFGAAAALKYSNALYALAGIVLVLTVPAGRWKALLAYAAGGTLSVTALAGFWLLRLWREFGNPMFPHASPLFSNPDLPSVHFTAERFAPQTLGEALLTPLRLISPESMTYAEISAPDLRFVALVAVAVALAVGSLFARYRAKTAARALTATDSRLLAFFAVAAALWVGSSSNARYGMLVLLLAGPCLARLSERLLPLRFAYVALPVLLAAQLAACAAISPPRWFIVERWTQDWFPLTVPPSAREAPALYLTVEAQAMASVTPYLHPGSSFVNLRGQLALGPKSRRLPDLLERKPIRVLGRALRLQADGRPRQDVVEVYDSTLLRFGYRVDPNQCFQIGWQPNDADFLSKVANAVSSEPRPLQNVLSLASCALVPAVRDPREIDEELRFSRIFDRIERSCPRLFRGQTSVTERLGDGWARSYVSLEARLESNSGRAVLVPWFKLSYYDLGSLDEWEGGKVPSPKIVQLCGTRPNTTQNS